jgi:competence protein ComEA
MSEITRAQFAIAAVVVAFLAWTVAHRGAPRTATTGAGPGVGATSTPARPPGQAPAAARGEGTDVVVSRAPKARIVVHVAGAVRRPGVYRLRDGQRVADAVKRAGGASDAADLNAINLATKAHDGVQILVPRRGAAVASAPAAGATSAPGGVPGAAVTPAIVNLNSATAEQLETLDGVGPATATKILQFRAEHGPFRSVDDLEQIPGIGPKKLAAMRPGATV